MKRRNKFNLSSFKNFTCDMGQLVPVYCKEVLPGDSWEMDTSLFMRLAPLNGPVMHPCHVHTHTFFVPNRLTWSDWENFITGGPDGLSAPSFPVISAPPTTGFAVGSLADYLGIKPGVTGRDFSALPFRAYALIYNELYRDQDLVPPLPISLASGADTTTNTTLVNAAWDKDYFTSSRPWEQKGAEVLLPLVGVAPVKGIGFNAVTGSTTNPTAIRESGNVSVTSYPTAVSLADSATVNATRIKTAGSGTSSYPDIYVEGDEFEAPSANEFRFQFAWQRVLEARARFGSRYTELLRAWGVKSSDARLQRPEYLGGSKETIQFSEVLGTVNNADTQLGQLGGHGLGSSRSKRFRRFFEEHGYVITLAFVRPITIYADGVERHWNRRTREEFWQPELQHIGQQTIKNKEVYLAHPDPDGSFGFQDRFDEHRRSESSIAAEFRTYYDYMSLARLFGSAPALNASFVTCSPSKDIYQSTGTHGLIVMAHTRCMARRLVAKTGYSYLK